MSQQSTRKKDPEGVRKALLECASAIAAEKGVAGVTISAVASAAGVTKGGLFHHFASKEALVNSIVEDLFNQLDQQIDDFILRDSLSKGCFTRAYIRVTFTNDEKIKNIWNALLGLIFSDPMLKNKWDEWIISRLEKHSKTDNTPQLELARLAADGAWLAIASNSAYFLNLVELEKNLIDLTLK